MPSVTDVSNEEISFSWTEESDTDPSNSGWTPLMRAARYGQTDEVAQLIFSGTDVTTCDNLGWNAVPLAVASGNTETVKEILKATKWSREELAPALCLSSLNGDYDMAELLLRARANPNTPVKDSEITPLMLAAGEGHVRMVTLLLDRGADPDRTNALHQTALDAAVCRGHQTVQDILAPVTHLRSKVSSHIPLPISPPTRALQSSPDPSLLRNANASPFHPVYHNAFLMQVVPPHQSNGSHLSPFHSTELYSTPVGIARALHLQVNPDSGVCLPYCPIPEDCSVVPSPLHVKYRNNCSSPLHASCSFSTECLSNFQAGSQRKFDRSPYQKDSCCSRDADGQMGRSPQQISARRHQKMVLRGNKGIRKWWCQMKKRCKGAAEGDDDALFALKDERLHEKRLENFLRSIKMTEYLPAFTAQEVDFETFLTLTDSDLEEIGIKNSSHRSRIVDKMTKFSACVSNY